MKITPKIQFIQEKILLSVYPGLSIEEARAEEAKKKGCLIELFDGTEIEIWWYDEETQAYRDCRGDWYDSGNFGTGQGEVPNTVFGIPPSLSRVLHCLGAGRTLQYEHYPVPVYMIAQTATRTYTPRKLLNDDGTECTLFDQSQETIDAIFTLLGGEG